MAIDLIQAKYYKSGRLKPIDLIVMHDMEAPETTHTARDVGKYLANCDREASAHIGVDSFETIRYVADEDTAYGAPGVNSRALHLELAGYMGMSPDNWLNEYGVAMLNRAASVVACWSKAHNIPIVHLTNDQLQAGAKGLVGHRQVSQVYKESDHMDPGPNFPWDYFIDNCNERLCAIQ